MNIYLSVWYTYTNICIVRHHSSQYAASERLLRQLYTEETCQVPKLPKVIFFFASYPQEVGIVETTLGAHLGEAFEMTGNLWDAQVILIFGIFEIEYC